MNSPSRSHMTVGVVVADTYKLEALIGRGGMGDVFAASHLRLPGKQVAIKFLHPEVADPEILLRFRREAEIASRLGHPNIVTVLDFNNLPDGTPYLVLEYLVGETLADALTRGPFSVERMLAIARQLGSALAAAHRAGVVHRDLKPQNIFLVSTEIDGHLAETAKILDFGISKIRGSQTVKTQDSALLGTPQYMAPEQATGQHDLVDGRTDIFAVGAILYEMLVGLPAFSGASIPEVMFKVVYEPAPPLAQRVTGVAPVIITAIERAMAKKSDARFATIGEMVTALTGVGLATLPPIAGAASEARIPARKVDSAAALAHTIGSGDHADAGQATAYERPAAMTPAAPPAAAISAALPPVPVAQAAPTRRKWWLAAAAAAAAITAAVTAFLLLRPQQPTPSGQVAAGALGVPGRIDAGIATPDTSPAATPDVLQTTASDASPPTSADAATALDAASGPRDAGAHRRPRTPPKPRDPPPPTAPPPSNQADGKKFIDQVMKAGNFAKSGQNAAAKQQANAILDDPEAPGWARSAAHEVIVWVACRADDRETAMRAAKSAGKVRPAVISECRNHDIDLPLATRRRRP